MSKQTVVRAPARGRSPAFARSDCPISIALEALGDGWSLLIVRDLMFKGRKTYKEFLEAEEGIASNVLANRLQRLEGLGLISKSPDPSDARRRVYRLTEAGLGLAPMLVELVLWSAKHFRTGAPPEAIDEMQNHRGRFLKHVRKDWEGTDPASRNGPKTLGGGASQAISHASTARIYSVGKKPSIEK